MDRAFIPKASLPLCLENLSLLAEGLTRKDLPACPVHESVAVFVASDILAEANEMHAKDVLRPKDQSDTLSHYSLRAQGAALLARACGSSASVVKLLEALEASLMARANALAAEGYELERRQEAAVGREDGGEEAAANG